MESNSLLALEVISFEVEELSGRERELMMAILRFGGDSAASVRVSPILVHG